MLWGGHGGGVDGVYEYMSSTRTHIGGPRVPPPQRLPVFVYLSVRMRGIDRLIGVASALKKISDLFERLWYFSILRRRL